MKLVQKLALNRLKANRTAAQHTRQVPLPLIVTRRRFLAASAFVSLLLNPFRLTSVHATQIDANTIRQPATPNDKAFIAQAFKMRDLAVNFGDQAYGAVIVRDGTIIGQSWSRAILDQDPTGHAEISAIRDAARRLSSRELGGATIYSSSRPCPMCEAAAYWAGISKMVHGPKAENIGSPQLCR